MTPTSKLRFVEREIQMPVQGDFVVTYKTVRILQQWWEKDIASQYTAAIAGDSSGEWRDVPLEEQA